MSNGRGPSGIVRVELVENVNRSWHYGVVARREIVDGLVGMTMAAARWYQTIRSIQSSKAEVSKLYLAKAMLRRTAIALSGADLSMGTAGARSDDDVETLRRWEGCKLKALDRRRRGCRQAGCTVVMCSTPTRHCSRGGLLCPSSTTTDTLAPVWWCLRCLWCRPVCLVPPAMA